MSNEFLVLNFGIPDFEMKTVLMDDKFPNIQTHKFNWNLIKSLEKSKKNKYIYISARPISDYPFYPKRRIKKNRYSIEIKGKKSEIIEIPFVNISFLKIITRLLSSLYYSIKEFNKFKNKKGIIVYSVHIPFMLTGYILSKIYNIDFITIWTDPPALRHSRESFVKSKLRLFEEKLSKHLMSKSDKAIVLTKYLANDFAPNTPFLVIEGIIDEKDINKNLGKKRKTKLTTILYSGSLEKKYGIKNIVEGFLLLENKNVILEIFGRGDFELELKKICENHPNVIYKGFVENKEILKAQRNADFLINARSANDSYVKYSFPSKTLEYMLSGTPLITTMLPGMPKEYEKYLLILKNNEPKTICKKINDVVNLNEDQRNKIGMNALIFAKTKNYVNQGTKINNFIEN